MRLNARLVSLSALALAACGRQSEPAPPTPPPAIGAPSAAPAAGLVTPEIAAKLKALPPPYNEADYTNGRRVFAQCRSCHQTDPSAGNSVGPNLHGVFGRKAGSLPGFAYSPALKGAGFTWDEGKIDQWISGPSKMLPGTRMTFAGLRDPNARRDVIAYLRIETEK